MMAGRGVLAVAFGAAIALWRVPVFTTLVVLALPHVDSDRAALALATYAIVFGIAITLASLRFRRAWP